MQPFQGQSNFHELDLKNGDSEWLPLWMNTFSCRCFLGFWEAFEQLEAQLLNKQASWILHIEAETKYFGIFKFIFWYKHCCILIQILMKFVSESPIDNIPALVQIMV